MDEQHRGIINKWITSIRNAAKDYKDLVYNSHTVLRDYWSYEEISWMPIRDVLDEVAYFTPKLKEIARQQEADRLKAELAGKQNMVKPGRRGK